jgi:hypothetical protein
VGNERRSDQKLQLSEKLGTGTRLQKNGWQKNELRVIFIFLPAIFLLCGGLSGWS